MSSTANIDLRDHVEFLQASELNTESYSFGDLSPGLRAFELTGTPCSDSTLLLKGSPIWRFQEDVIFRSDVEILILTGDLFINKTALSRGDYIFIKAGQKVSDFRTHLGFELLWMSNGPNDWIIGETAVASNIALINPTNAIEMPWMPSPSYEGRPAEEADPALGVKILRQDPETTAYTLMTRHQPGWVDRRLEAHDTWEELFLLQGDYLMGTTGMINGGAYIFRPPTRPHGPQATHTGAVWFCRGEKEIDFQYSYIDWAEGQVEEYLTYMSDQNSEMVSPWGNWWGD